MRAQITATGRRATCEGIDGARIGKLLIDDVEFFSARIDQRSNWPASDAFGSHITFFALICIASRHLICDKRLMKR